MTKIWAVWPALRVIGNDAPESENCALLMPAELSVTAAPLADTVHACVAFEPTSTFPKLNVAGLTVSCPAWVVPVPLSVSVTVGVCALLVKESVPVADPAAMGLKVTVKGTLCPAGTVIGNDRPLTLNEVLLTLSLLIVMLAPEALRVPDALPLLPTVTLPKLSDVGFTASCPTGAVPVPLSDSVVVGVCALLANERLPLAAPAAVGRNVTVNGRL